MLSFDKAKYAEVFVYNPDLSCHLHTFVSRQQDYQKSCFFKLGRK